MKGCVQSKGERVIVATDVRYDVYAGPSVFACVWWLAVYLEHTSALGKATAQNQCCVQVASAGVLCVSQTRHGSPPSSP